MESKLSSAAAFVEGDMQDACDNARNICLEPFCDSNPSTVYICDTSFKKEFENTSEFKKEFGNVVQKSNKYAITILSAGTNSAINLWLAKIGCDEYGPESPSGSPSMQDEPLLNSYTDYENSIYGIAWSSHDPYFFTSLSYDGRVVLESVKPYMQRK